jgi:hypothetical protein
MKNEIINKVKALAHSIERVIGRGANINDIINIVSKSDFDIEDYVSSIASTNQVTDIMYHYYCYSSLKHPKIVLDIKIPEIQVSKEKSIDFTKVELINRLIIKWFHDNPEKDEFYASIIDIKKGFNLDIDNSDIKQIISKYIILHNPLKSMRYNHFITGTSKTGTTYNFRRENFITQ